MPEIDILVETEGWERIGDLEATIRKAAGAALTAGGKSAA